jgi:hypothetical protein
MSEQDTPKVVPFVGADGRQEQEAQVVPREESKCLSCSHSFLVTLQKTVQAPPSPLMAPGAPLALQVVHAEVVSCTRLNLFVGDVVVKCEAHEPKAVNS